MKRFLLLTLLFFVALQGWGQNLTGKWTNGELLEDKDYGAAHFTQYYLDLVQSNQKITGTMYEEVSSDNFALYELEGTFDGRTLNFLTTKILKQSGSWCHEKVSYSFNFDKGKYILAGGLIEGYYRCEPGGYDHYFGGYTYRFVKDKGIIITSPTAGTILETNKSFGIDFKDQNGSLGVSYVVELYKIGGSTPIYSTKVSIFVQDYQSYKIPDYVPAGEYELRVTSKTGQEVSGSVKIMVAKGKECPISVPTNVSTRRGVTLLTHGFSAGGSGLPSWLPWVGGTGSIISNWEEYARMIRKRINGQNIEQGKGATIYINVEGRWKVLDGENGHGDTNEEIILIYDWQNLSNRPLPASYGTGYLEAAADNLFAMLVDATGDLKGNLIETKPVHMIGHSRGTIMLIQTLHRIGHYFPNIKIEQLTTLDPHPATTYGDVVFREKDTFSSLPGLTDKIVDGCTLTIGCDQSMGIQLRVPENVIYADSYYRRDGHYEGLLSEGNIVPFIGSFDGITVEGIPQKELDEEKIKLVSSSLGGTHSGMHLWYFGTVGTHDDLSKRIELNWYGKSGALKDVTGKIINECRYNTGYYYSRNGDASQAEMNSLKPSKFVTIAEMDKQLTIRPRTDSKSHNKLGILNGNFEYGNDSGWWKNGGNYDVFGGDAIRDGFGFFKDVNQNYYVKIGSFSWNEEIYTTNELTHSYFFFPKNIINTANNYEEKNNFISFDILDFSANAEIDFYFKNLNPTQYNTPSITYDYNSPIRIKPNTKGKYSVEIPEDLKGKMGTFSFKNNTGFCSVDNIEFTSSVAGKLVQLIKPEYSFTLYPNPTTTQFSLDLKDIQGTPQQLEITDKQGNVIYQQAIDSTCCENITAPFAKEDNYIIRVITDKGVFSKKISVKP